MSYPKDRQHRFLIGKTKGKRRAKRLLCTSKHSEETLRYFSYILRNTTKLCSCDMCGNPRRTGWHKKEDTLTMQERKQKDWKENYNC